jgi:hypothetical protein
LLNRNTPTLFPLSYPCGDLNVWHLYLLVAFWGVELYLGCATNLTLRTRMVPASNCVWDQAMNTMVSYHNYKRNKYLFYFDLSLLEWK